MNDMTYYLSDRGLTLRVSVRLEFVLLHLLDRESARLVSFLDSIPYRFHLHSQVSVHSRVFAPQDWNLYRSAQGLNLLLVVLESALDLTPQNFCPDLSQYSTSETAVDPQISKRLSFPQR